MLCCAFSLTATAGWKVPTGHTDGAGWSHGNLARDDNTATYSRHSPVLGWGDWETFSLDASIWSDRLRVMTDFGYGEVDSVQIEVSLDNAAWTTVFAGAVADAAWETKNYTAQDLQYARFRFHRVATGYIFWLYELQLFETPLTIDPPTVTTLAATSVDETSAVVHGQLDDDGGEPCDLRFQYGLTLGYELGTTAWIPDYVVGATAGTAFTGLTDGLTYHYRIQGRNSQATVDGSDATFTCSAAGTGWVSPNSFTDASGRWVDVPNAYDDETGSFTKCHHPSGDPNGQWSSYLYLEHSSMPVDSIRFYAKDDSNIDSAQVEVSPDGISWTRVYDGSFSNLSWITVPFSPQHANQARIRFHVSGNGAGLYWELYEFDFHQTPRPVFDPVSAQAVAEGDTLTFDVSATDINGDPLFLSAENLPANASFVDSTDGTGSLLFLPDYTQSGIDTLLFIASDGVLADSEYVEVTITGVNLQPLLDPIGPHVVAEGDTLAFVVSATDADADSLILSVENLPPNATFVDSTDGTGSLLFLPDYTQSGVDTLRFIVSDGALADSELVEITITHVNLPPVLDPIGSRSVTEGDTLAFVVSATDADGDSLILSAEDLPPNATFVDSTDGTGSLLFLPDYTQSGADTLRFLVTDGALADSELVEFTITEVNLPPVLTPIGQRAVDEGDTLLVSVSATDADGDSLILEVGDMPENATFVDSGNGTGSLLFLPDYDQAGLHTPWFIVSDGVLSDNEVVEIAVLDVDSTPILESIGPHTIREGDTLRIRVTAHDADGDSVSLSVEELPPNASFADSGDGVGGLIFAPELDQLGIHELLFIATDGEQADSERVEITVTDVDQAPVLIPIGPQTVAEGDTLSVNISASDADGDSLVLSAEGAPPNSSFADHGDGTGSWLFSPDYTQNGVYELVFIASDGELADSEHVSVTVTNVDVAPVWAPVDSQLVAEGDTLSFVVSATDADGDSLTLSAEGLPPNASFTDGGDGTGSVSFLPDFTQEGIYDVLLIASDGALADSGHVEITVTDTGLAPVLAQIGPRSVVKGDTLAFVVTATDADGDSLFLSVEDLPENSSLLDDGDGSGTFVFLPGHDQVGVYTPTFFVSDGELSDSELVTITVVSENRAPELALIGPQTVEVGSALSVPVTATDADGDSLILFAEDLPANAEFVDHGDGTGSFEFEPGSGQVGLHEVTVWVSDGALVGGTLAGGALADSERVEILVTAGNQAPVLASIGPRTIDEGDTLDVEVSATDADGDSLALWVESLPENASFIDQGDGTGHLTFQPDFMQAGLYELAFHVSDGKSTDSETVELSVSHVNLVPELASIGPQAIAEGDSLLLLVVATDADGDSLTLSADGLPANASFLDAGNGTGTLRFVPDFDQAGTFSVTLAASDGHSIDTEEVEILVAGVNRPPALASIGPQTVAELDTLVLDVSAVDADEDALILSVVGLPENATFDDAGDGTGRLVWVPSHEQAGVYELTFIVADGVVAGDGIAGGGIAGGGTARGGSGTGAPADGASTDSALTDGALTDGALTDSEHVTITVVDVNRAPALSAIGPQSIPEGNLLTVPVHATDADGDSLTLSVTDLPPNASFADSGGGAGVLSFLPDLSQAGSYTLTFTVSDGTLLDSESVVLSVTENDWVTISGSVSPDGSGLGGIGITDAGHDGVNSGGIGQDGANSGGAHSGGVSLVGVNLASVVLSVDGDTSLVAFADSSGAYAFDVPYGWSGTVTPILKNAEFYPPERSYDSLLADLTGQDFEPVLVSRDDPRFVPDQFYASQNFPNPIDSATTIEYGLPHPSRVRVEVYNVAGQVVRTLVDGTMPAGTHRTHWDGRDRDGRLVVSGTYLCRVVTDGFARTRKMVLVR